MSKVFSFVLRLMFVVLSIVYCCWWELEIVCLCSDNAKY
jgi:hypothetical protein